MTIQSSPFYWIACDGEGCTNRCPEEGAEIAAWQQPDGAEEDALGCEWTTDGDGHWLCLDCGPFCDCGKPAGPLSGEREYMCPGCAGVAVFTGTIRGEGSGVSA